jgi:Rrf2 family protein
MRTDYSVRAMIDLALHYGQGPQQSRDIAARQRIPEAYLDQLLTTLRKAGLIRSMRGPQGGHTLARRPSEIFLGEVVEAVEGPFVPIGCMDDAENCELGPTCAQREVWREVRHAVRQILQRTTIDEMARRQERGLEEARYYI